MQMFEMLERYLKGISGREHGTRTCADPGDAPQRSGEP